MALLKIEEVSANVRVGIWEATEDIEFFKSRLPLGFLTGYNEERFSENRKREFLASRFLLRKMLNADYSVIEVGENGSIYVAGGVPFISLSHSKKMVAAMVGRNVPVGIDIEEISGRVKKVMHKFTNEHERQLLGSNPDLWKITLCWSAKESIYKMAGQPGLSFSDDIILEIPRTGDSKKFTVLVRKNGMENEQTIFFEMINEFILTYCCETRTNQQ